MAVDVLGSGAGRASGASMGSSEEQDTGIPPTQKKKLWALTKQAGSKTIQMAKDMKKIASSGAGMLGINFSLGAILKQSQIFTGIMGSISNFRCCSGCFYGTLNTLLYSVNAEDGNHFNSMGSKKRGTICGLDTTNA